MQGDFNWTVMPKVAKGPLIKLGLLLGLLLLAGLVLAACSSAPPTSGSTPTLLPALVETPTSVSTTTPSPNPTAASDTPPLLVQLEGLEISNKGNVIRVFLPGLPQTVAEQVRSFPAVTKVEKYLRVLRPDYPDLFWDRARF